jgi:FKBP-type peptidyl-prolyl cis-trans isomerase 2
MRWALTIGSSLTMVLGTILLDGVPASASKPEAVGNGTKVTLDYTLTLPDNTVADSTVGQEPMSYVHGAHQIIPGLEKELTGMKVGEKKQITVPSRDAYGPYDEKNKVTIPKERVPNNVQVGMLLRAREGGQPVRVIEVNEKEVVIDANHPLAGKDLHFDVKILNVEPAPAPSMESGKLP